MSEMKAVFHISDKDRWKVALANLENFYNATLDKVVQIEVVANATAVLVFFEESDFLKKIDSLAGRGIKFSACRNSIKKQELHEAVLPAYITIVSAGVVAVVEKQMEGYAYIKP